MGKNYTLYINQSGFETEINKSGLVNLLLARHYDVYLPGTLVKDMSDLNVIGDSELEKIIDPSAGQCEHGCGVRLCLEKKCKNYQFRKGAR